LRTVSGDNSFCSTIIESATIKLSSSSMLPTCNIIMRHAVNKSVHAGIKVKPESFAAFKIEMASPSFKEELEKARDNPKSREAGKLIQRLMIFICMSGVKIPWSPEKRKREMSYIDSYSH